MERLVAATFAIDPAEEIGALDEDFCSSASLHKQRHRLGDVVRKHGIERVPSSSHA